MKDDFYPLQKLVEEAKKRGYKMEMNPEALVIMITAYASVETAIEAMKAGAVAISNVSRPGTWTGPATRSPSLGSSVMSRAGRSGPGSSRGTVNAPG